MNTNITMALKAGILSPGTGSSIGDNLAMFFSRFNVSNSGETIEEFAAMAELTSASEILKEIKNSTGLSWKRMAELFSVSRRAVYDWLEGKPMSDHNYSKLCKVEEALKPIKYDTPYQMRTLLLFGNRAGENPYQLLKQSRYAEFSQFIQDQAYNFEQAEHLTDISPVERISTRQGKVHTDLPRKRRSKASRRRPAET